MKKLRRDLEPAAASPGAEPHNELDEFARAMADVRPLPPDRRGNRAHARPIVHEPRASAPPSTASSSNCEPVAPDRQDAGFVAPGIDRRELRKLKRGDYLASDSLDLHGMTVAQAETSVRRFIERCRARHRCVCIVHGRGLRSKGNVPVLRPRVRDVLRRHRGVLAFADAPRDAGGDGAVYVLLRR